MENARLAELERLRRGSLSFLVEASDLLAGTLEHEQTLALMAQMAVPTLAAWCAVYTIAEQSRTAHLAFVLHEDEERIDGLRALLSQVRPPEADATPGARIWTAPRTRPTRARCAHRCAVSASARTRAAAARPAAPASPWPPRRP